MKATTVPLEIVLFGPGGRSRTTVHAIDNRVALQWKYLEYSRPMSGGYNRPDFRGLGEKGNP